MLRHLPLLVPKDFVLGVLGVGFLICDFLAYSAFVVSIYVLSIRRIGREGRKGR